MISRLEWYGYRHVDGSLHLKRYLSRASFEEACESDFVDAVYGPFEADTREEAAQKLRAMAGRAAS